MQRKFRIIYRRGGILRAMHIDACSKYEVKKKFRNIHPEYEYVSCEEVKEVSNNDNTGN